MLFKSKLPDIEFPDVSLYQFVFEGEKSFSQDKPCYVEAEDRSRLITFNELKNLVLRFGAGLKQLTGFH